MISTMGRRTYADPLMPIKIGPDVVPLPASLMRAFPDTIPFFTHLRERGYSIPTAKRYVYAIAKERQSGRWLHPDIIGEALSHSALTAYWKWITTHYSLRLSRVLKTVISGDLRAGIGRLRVGSLVGPFAGKAIPWLGAPMSDRLPDGTFFSLPREVQWQPTEHWTLHVPPTNLPVHKDPCVDCTTIELNDEQLRAVSEAFYDAWGTAAKPWEMPPECFLFGQPPLVGDFAPTPDVEPVGRIVALLPDGPICAAMEQLKAAVAGQVGAFIDRLADRRPDVIVLSRALVDTRLEEVLAAVRAAWKVEEAAGANGESKPNGESGEVGQGDPTALM